MVAEKTYRVKESREMTVEGDSGGDPEDLDSGGGRRILDAGILNLAPDREADKKAPGGAIEGTDTVTVPDADRPRQVARRPRVPATLQLHEHKSTGKSKPRYVIRVNRIIEKGRRRKTTNGYPLVAVVIVFNPIP